MRIPRHRLRLVVALLAPMVRIQAQPAPELKQILDRLDHLEAENRELRDQIRALQEGRATPAPGAPTEATLEEKVAIDESRIAELAQVKVEASQKFPIRITGMALVNTFLNSQQNGGSDNPTVASVAGGGAVGGATWRQTIIGLDYRGPTTFWDGKIHGSVFMDFFAGTNSPLNNTMRIRTASFGIDWKTRSFTISQDKPLISFRDPDSLSQVGVSPLTAAGNLWVWTPQARFEQKISFGDNSGLNAQVAIIQTNEASASVPPAFSSTLERYRPGYEGRFEYFRKLAAQRRIEIASGFHASTTHVAGGSAPSRVFFVDWSFTPMRRIELTGTFFNGENVALFGTGGIRQGFWIVGPRSVLPVHSRGGWTQLKLIGTDRLSFHLMYGQQDDRDSDVRAGFFTATGGGIGKNQAYGANFFYKLSSNVIASFEVLQTRTTYLAVGNRLNNHYDLAFAYLF